MRIISGQFRGKKLHNAEHLLGLRPTTDKNRESLFNILISGKAAKEANFKITDSNVLDICCGTGSVSFESISRGAKSAFLIDENSFHLNLAKKNSELLKVEQQCQFLLCDVKKDLPKSVKEFDLVFIDPPYAEDYKSIIVSLLEKGWIVKSSLVVIEFNSTNELKDFALEEFTVLDVRRYGKTSFAFLKL
jgi:16S rRNA (guanine966-N2)-methyltransferase